MVHFADHTAAEPTCLPVAAVRHLTQHDLARRWRISTRTLERWRWLRQGPAYLKLGGSVAYRIEDIERYETARLQPGAVMQDEALGAGHAALGAEGATPGLAASDRPKR